MEDDVQTEEVGWNDAVADHCDAHVEDHVRDHGHNLDGGAVAHGMANAVGGLDAVEARHMGHPLCHLCHLFRMKAHLVDE
jgi:hypothetical protein